VDWSPTWGRKNVVTRLLEAMFAAPQEHVPYRRQHRDVSDGVQALGVILGAACGECLSNFDNAPVEVDARPPQPVDLTGPHPGQKTAQHVVTVVLSYRVTDFPHLVHSEWLDHRPRGLELSEILGWVGEPVALRCFAQDLLQDNHDLVDARCGEGFSLRTRQGRDVCAKPENFLSRDVTNHLVAEPWQQMRARNLIHAIAMQASPLG